MAITFKQVIQSAPANAASQNVSITPNAAGNLLIVGVGVLQKGFIQSVTDNNNNVWIPVIYNNEGGNAGGAIYYTGNCNSGATTITVTLTTSQTDLGVCVHEYSGCAKIHPIDGFAVGTGSTGTAVSTANLTTTQSNDVIFSLCCFIDQNISSIGGGYTLRSNLGTNVFTASGDLAAATPGTYTGQWNAAVNTNYNLMAVALSPVDVPNPAPTPMQTAIAETTTDSSPITATFSNNVTAGNAIVVLCLGDSGMTWTGVTDSESSSYASCTGASVSGAQMFVAFGVSGGTAAAVHAAYSGSLSSRGAVYAIEVRDITKYDKGSGNTASSSTPSSGSFTLGFPNEIIFAADHSLDSNPEPSQGSGYLGITLTSTFANLIEYAVPVTGAQNATATLTGTLLWTMIAGGFYTPQGIIGNTGANPVDAIFFGIT